MDPLMPGRTQATLGHTKGDEDETSESGDSGRRSRIRAVANAGLRKRKRPQPTGHRHQEIGISLPPQWLAASNPFASSWALQLQQNNNWTEVAGSDDHARVQSNLLFSRC
jgi:hypothetical protein